MLAASQSTAALPPSPTIDSTAPACARASGRECICTHFTRLAAATALAKASIANRKGGEGICTAAPSLCDSLVLSLAARWRRRRRRHLFAPPNGASCSSREAFAFPWDNTGSGCSFRITAAHLADWRATGQRHMQDSDRNRTIDPLHVPTCLPVVHTRLQRHHTLQPRSGLHVRRSKDTARRKHDRRVRDSMRRKAQKTHLHPPLVLQLRQLLRRPLMPIITMIPARARKRGEHRCRQELSTAHNSIVVVGVDRRGVS